MKVDWDELKRLHEATTKGPWMLVPFNAPATHGVEPYCLRISDKGPRFVSVDRGESLCAADGEWIAALHNAFPAILAERSAAQRLRDAVLHHFGTEGVKQWKNIADALAAFDKETQNEG